MRYTTLICAILLSAGTLSAQVPLEFEPGRSVQTRADLERLLVEYEQALSSPVYSGGVKESIRANATRVRSRLEFGDFRVGDRIALSIQGEAAFPDTVPVVSGPGGPILTLDIFGDIPLRGVLRSEVEAHLTQEIGRFIKDPVVRATGLMRLGILGAVGNPGFFVVPSDMLLTEALMYAGGPGTAPIDKIRIERNGQEILGGDDLQAAIVEGRTLDQLNLQAGDQVFVPTATTGQSFVRSAGRFVLVLATTVLFGIRVF